MLSLELHSIPNPKSAVDATIYEIVLFSMLMFAFTPPHTHKTRVVLATHYSFFRRYSTPSPSVLTVVMVRQCVSVLLGAQASPYPSLASS